VRLGKIRAWGCRAMRVCNEDISEGWGRQLTTAMPSRTPAAAAHDAVSVLRMTARRRRPTRWPWKCMSVRKTVPPRNQLRSEEQDSLSVGQRGNEFALVLDNEGVHNDESR